MKHDVKKKTQENNEKSVDKFVVERSFEVNFEINFVVFNDVLVRHLFVFIWFCRKRC